MGRISQSIPSLFNGVSQQAATLRLRSQGEEQINFYSTIAAGLAKRPPSRHIAKLTSDTDESAKAHLIETSDGGQYILILKNKDLLLYDLDGTAKTVNFPDGKEYLDASTPIEDFRVITVLDTTFILNKNIVTAMVGVDIEDVTTFQNGGFETAGSGGEDIFANWVEGWYGDQGVWQDSSVKHSGTYSCRLEDNAGVTFSSVVYEYVDLETDGILPGMTVRLSFWTRGDGTYQGRYAVLARGNGQLLDYLIYPQNTGVPGVTWTQIVRDFVIPDGCDELCIEFICAYDADPNVNDVWFDDVELEYFPASLWSPVAIHWTKTGVASTDYTITLNGTEYKYTSGVTSSPDSYKTTYIADQLKTLINAGGTFTATRVGSVLKIVKTATGSFTFEYSDSWGEQATTGFYQDVKTYQDLPPKCWDSIKARIVGNTGSSEDNYYAEFDGDTQLWKETCGWELVNNISACTMPHKLVKLPNGQFNFEQIDWASRTVGDSDSCPTPSFIGNTINDIFFYRNRLGFLSEDNVIMSKAGDYYNFWRDTITQVLDTDPIDTPANNIKASVLHSAIPFNKDLLLFSDKTQFILSAEGFLTPTTVKVQQSTEFENDPTCQPTTAGPYIYFTLRRGDYTGVKEFYVDKNNDNQDAADITAHVPRYIPKDVFRLTASSNEDVIFTLTLQERNVIYVYKYYWAGEDKLQSSWSKWVFGTGDVILDVAMLESTVYIVVKRSDGIYLEKMYLMTDEEDTGLGFLVHLDRRCELTGVYANGETTWTLPYSDSTVNRVVRSDDFTGEEGNQILSITRPTATTIKVTGDYSSGVCYCGKTYESRYALSQQYVRTGQNHEESVTEGRLTLQRGLVNFSDSGLFKVEVSPGNEATYTYLHSLVLGSSDATIGEAFIRSGSIAFPILGLAKEVEIELVNDDYLPSVFQSIEWEAFHVMHTQRN